MGHLGRSATRSVRCTIPPRHRSDPPFHACCASQAGGTPRGMCRRNPSFAGRISSTSEIGLVTIGTLPCTSLLRWPGTSCCTHAPALLFGGRFAKITEKLAEQPRLIEAHRKVRPAALRSLGESARSSYAFVAYTHSYPVLNCPSGDQGCQT